MEGRGRQEDQEDQEDQGEEGDGNDEDERGMKRKEPAAGSEGDM